MCLIPKIDNPVTLKDFQAVSILPLLFKVYENAILSQLLNYIEKSDVYNPTQSGFRRQLIPSTTKSLWQSSFH